MIFAVKPFEIHDGDGIRTTVFFKGCPLRCRWCHNPESLLAVPQLSFAASRCVNCGLCSAVCPSHRMVNGFHEYDRSRCIACGKCTEVCSANALKLYGIETDTDSLVKQLQKDSFLFKANGGGVTLSGGEPLLQADFAAELLRNLKDRGINTAVDTCGAVPWSSFEKVLPYTDTFLYDVKAFDPEVHRKCTGMTNETILSNLKKLCDRGCRVEVRIPYVPGMNDSEIPAIAGFLKNLPLLRIRVLPYHNFALTKYEDLGMTTHQEDFRVPDAEEIRRAIEIFRAAGCHAVTSAEIG